MTSTLHESDPPRVLCAPPWPAAGSLGRWALSRVLGARARGLLGETRVRTPAAPESGLPCTPPRGQRQAAGGASPLVCRWLHWGAPWGGAFWPHPPELPHAVRGGPGAEKRNRAADACALGPCRCERARGERGGRGGRGGARSRPAECEGAGRAAGSVGLGRGACVLPPLPGRLPLPAAPGFGFASGSGPVRSRRPRADPTLGRAAGVRGHARSSPRGEGGILRSLELPHRSRAVARDGPVCVHSNFLESSISAPEPRRPERSALPLSRAAGGHGLQARVGTSAVTALRATRWPRGRQRRSECRDGGGQPPPTCPRSRPLTPTPAGSLGLAVVWPSSEVGKSPEADGIEYCLVPGFSFMPLAPAGGEKQ